MKIKSNYNDGSFKFSHTFDYPIYHTFGLYSLPLLIKCMKQIWATASFYIILEIYSE